MQARFSLGLCLFAVLVIVSESSVALAQATKKPPERVSGTAKIEALVPPDGFQIKLKEETFLLKFKKKTPPRVTGTATFDLLKPGHSMQFNAMFNKKTGQVRDPVKKFILYTECAEFTPGVFEDTLVKVGPDDDPAYSPYVVSGQVKNVRGQTVLLSVPGVGATVKVEVAENAKIDLNIDDISVVQPGDSITLSRADKDPKNPKNVNLSLGTIKLAKPLSAPSKQAKKPGR